MSCANPNSERDHDNLENGNQFNLHILRVDFEVWSTDR